MPGQANTFTGQTRSAGPSGIVIDGSSVTILESTHLPILVSGSSIVLALSSQTITIPDGSSTVVEDTTYAVNGDLANIAFSQRTIPELAQKQFNWLIPCHISTLQGFLKLVILNQVAVEEVELD